MVCAILKVAYQGEIRRTRVTKNEIVYHDILAGVSALFPDVKEYAAMYLDDEGDACTLCQASFSDFLAMSKKAASQTSVDAQHLEKLLLKLEIKDVHRSTAQAPADETFERQIKQAIEQVAQGIDFAQCRKDVSEFVHGFLDAGREEVQCSKPASRSVSFTDTEGDRSTLRLDHQMLSWHAGGRCYLERIKRLEFDARTNAIKAPEHPALVARLVDPPAGLQRDALVQDIVHMAGIAGVELHGFPMQSLPSRSSDSLSGKPGMKENAPTQERPTVRLPAEETFEKQLKQAMEQVVHGLDFAQWRGDVSELVHGFRHDSGEEVQCGKPTSHSVSFTDTEGDRSTLCLDHQMLSWHAGGRCYLERIKRLEFDADTNAIKAPEHPALVARLVDPPAGLQRDALVQDIVHMAGVAGVELHGFPMQSPKAESEMRQTQVFHTDEQNIEELRQKAEKDARKAEKEKLQAEKEVRLAEKEKQRAEKVALKAYKEKLKNEKAAKLAEKEMQRAEKAAKLAEKETQKAEKEAQKAEKERQKAERLIEKEAKVAEKKAQKQLQKDIQKNEKIQQKAEKKAVNGNEGSDSAGETVDQISATRFGFPVMLADGCELQMVWSTGDDLQQVGAQFAKEHGLPLEIVPQLVSHAQQLDSSSEPSAAEEDPLQPQIRLLQDMGIHNQLDDQVLRSLLVSCHGDMQSVIEMLVHQ